MKIGILTIHFGVNHGSVLQAVALNKYLTRKGNETLTINYIPSRYSIWNSYYNEKKGKYSKILIAGYFPIYAFKQGKKRTLFKKYLDDHLPMTSLIRNKRKLPAVADLFDFIVVGSDQVWNSDYNGTEEKSYYLDFVPENKKKIAYAASFGKEELTSRQEYEALGNYFKSFAGISVREKNAVEIVAKCGYSAVHVVDPVFLLTASDWLALSSNENMYDEDYVLVYVMDGLYSDLINNAEVISKKLNCKIYVVSFSKIEDKRIDRMFYDITPDVFVEIVHNARFVITNSFHGTAFSVIFHKRLLVIGKEKYNSRVLSLLDMAGYEGRFIQPGTIVNNETIINLLQEEDVEQSEAKMKNWIDISKQWIDQVLTL